MDREMNKANYPFLKYPEVYLLHDGYKAFHETNKVTLSYFIWFLVIFVTT